MNHANTRAPLVAPKPTPLAAPPPQALFTIAESAARLALSKRYLHKLIDAKRLAVIRFGRAIRISADELQRLATEGIQ